MAAYVSIIRGSSSSTAPPATSLSASSGTVCETPALAAFHKAFGGVMALAAPPNPGVDFNHSMKEGPFCVYHFMPSWQYCKMIVCNAELAALHCQHWLAKPDVT